MADLGDVGVAIAPGMSGIAADSFSRNGVAHTGTISGTTTLGSGETPARAKVALRALNGGIVQFTESADDGTFAFDNLPSGQYEVVVFGAGVYRSEVFGPIAVS